MAEEAVIIDVYNDIINNVLVTSLTNPTLVKLNDRQLYQNSEIVFRWWPVKRPSSGQVSTANPYTLVPVTGLALQIAIGPRAGIEALLANQASFTDTGNGYLEGTLTVNTNEMVAAIANDDTEGTYIEFVMTASGKPRVTYQEAVTIQSVVIGPTGSVTNPTPAGEFYTKAQIDALLREYVKFINNPEGATLEFNNNGHVRVLGINPNGTPLDAHD